MLQTQVISQPPFHCLHNMPSFFIAVFPSPLSQRSGTHVVTVMIVCRPLAAGKEVGVQTPADSNGQIIGISENNGFLTFSRPPHLIVFGSRSLNLNLLTSQRLARSHLRLSPQPATRAAGLSVQLRRPSTQQPLLSASSHNFASDFQTPMWTCMRCRACYHNGSNAICELWFVHHFSTVV